MNLELNFLAMGTAFVATARYYPGFPQTRWEPADPPELEILSLVDADTGANCLPLLYVEDCCDYILEAAMEEAAEIMAERDAAEADALYQSWKDEQ